VQALAGQMHTHSVEEQSAVVDPWQVMLRQVSPGSFQGTMQFARIDEFLIYRDSWSQRTLATGALPADYLMFGGQVRPNSSIAWCGAELTTQRLALALPDAELDFIIPSQTPHLVLLIPVHCLELYFGEEAANSLLLAKRHHFQCDAQLGGRFLNCLQWMLDKYVSQPALLTDPGERQAARNYLLDELAALDLGTHQNSPPIRRNLQRQALRRALEYGESLRASISVPEFARKTGINQRSMELLFNKTLGITPRQYLYGQRLHGVHRELQLRQPTSRCVTQVATSWGFSELGRFAGDYRHLFGELPSATLKKHPASERVRLSDILR
jgi:AraC family ethanolamine operon transcriptional activator